MSFIADKQTLDDLNLLGKYKPDSVYSLFNKVRTKGGERLLDEMFRSPLSNPEEINLRSGIFIYLQHKGFDFSFKDGVFSGVEDYLGIGGSGNVLTATADLLRLRVMESLVKDERYAAIQAGVRGILSFLRDCRVFIGLFDENDPANPLREMIRAVKEILDDGRLTGLPFDESLSWRQLTRLHYLFQAALQEKLRRLCELLYHFDLYLAVSKVARERNFSYAYALPEEEYVFHALDLRHPALNKAIGNTISLGKRRNVLFLTGANMAGKSTFMKSFGIALYLAHMGFPVAANEMVFSVREGLYSSINVPDNLSLGYSHFYAEVRRVKEIAEEVGGSKSLVVIFDELFKGTNVKDAYDATLAVTAAFAEYRNCLFIVSTHIIEVGEALKEKHENLQFSFLPTVMDGMIPRYTYRLAEGITNDRHGMMIIEQEGILDIIKMRTGGAN